MNQMRQAGESAVPTPLLALDVQRAAMPGAPGGTVVPAAFIGRSSAAAVEQPRPSFPPSTGHGRRVRTCLAPHCACLPAAAQSSDERRAAEIRRSNRGVRVRREARSDRTYKLSRGSLARPGSRHSRE